MLATWVRELSDELDLQALCEVVVQRDVSAAFPSHADDEQFVASLRASVKENLHMLREVLAGRQQLSDVVLDQPLVFGAVQAQLRIPQTAMQRSYRVGFVAMWEAWVDHLLQVARADPSADVGELADQVVQLTRAIFEYQDHVAVQVADRLSREEQALNMSRTHVRNRLVSDVLDDPGVALSPADIATIGYPFDLHHLVILLPQVPEGAAARLVVGLRAASGVRDSLVLARQLDCSAIWLGRHRAWNADGVAAIRASLVATGVTATISDSRQGVSGFRETLFHAEETNRIRRSWDSGAQNVLEYSEVGLEILLLQDLALATRFVEDELGQLAEETDEAARLRDTLSASYHRGSHVAAAEHLHVHEHTVRNRLRKIEELLGHPLTERRTEKQVALRLLRLL